MEWSGCLTTPISNRISRNVYFLFLRSRRPYGRKVVRGRDGGRVRYDGMRKEGRKVGGWISERKQERNACVFWPVYLVGGF